MQKTCNLATITDVAKVFDVTPKTVSNWIEAGKIEAVTLPSGRKKVRREYLREKWPELFSD